MKTIEKLSNKRSFNDRFQKRLLTLLVIQRMMRSIFIYFVRSLFNFVRVFVSIVQKLSSFVLKMIVHFPSILFVFSLNSSLQLNRSASKIVGLAKKTFVFQKFVRKKRSSNKKLSFFKFVPTNRFFSKMLFVHKITPISVSKVQDFFLRFG